MIKAVIFDWGGVLIENPAPSMLGYFASSLGVTEKALNNAYMKFLQAFQKGIFSEDTLWKEICIELKISKPYAPSLWEEAFRRAYKPREEMFSLASALKKQGYKVGLLSNTEVRAMKYFQEQHYDMFDAAVFSCAEGTCKPELKIYQTALERLGVKADEAVFIDDRKDFLDGAQRVGMETILFTKSSQVKEELSYFLGKNSSW